MPRYENYYALFRKGLDVLMIKVHQTTHFHEQLISKMYYNLTPTSNIKSSKLESVNMVHKMIGSVCKPESFHKTKGS